MRSSLSNSVLRDWLKRWGTPSLLLLLAFGIRLIRLGDANLWWDEALAIWAVRKGPIGVTLWTAGDVHPPLYFWSLWTWVQVGGESEFAMRMLSVAMGVLTIATTYSLGKQLSARTAWLGALLVATARFHVWWSQEMRMYILAGLMGMLSIRFVLQWLDSEHDQSESRHWPGTLVGYVLCATGALYTIFISGIFLLAQNAIVLWLLLDQRFDAQKRRLLVRWIVAQISIGLILAAWMALSWNRMPTWSTAEPFGLKNLLLLWASLHTTGISVNVARTVCVAIVPLAALMGGTLLLWHDHSKRSHEIPSSAIAWVLLAAVAILAPVIVYMMSMPRGLFYSPSIEARYFIPFAPALWLLLARSLDRLVSWQRWAGWIAVAGVLAIWGWFLPGYYEGRLLKDEMQTMTRSIISQAEPGDAVLLDSGSRYPIFLYYYERLPDTVLRPDFITLTFSEDKLSTNLVDRKMPELVAEYDRIWLAEVDAGITDPERLIYQWLNARYPTTLAQGFQHNTLYLFDAENQPPNLSNETLDPQHLLRAEIGAKGLLIGWEMPVTEFAPGATTIISLLWEHLPSKPVDITLQTAGGAVVSRARAYPGEYRSQQRQLLPLVIPSALPKGNYDLVLDLPLPKDSVLTQVQIRTPDKHSPLAVAPYVDRKHLGDNIALTGYALNGSRSTTVEINSGDMLTVDLYWESLGQPKTDYTVFVHMVGQAHNPKTNGPLWGQHDGPPIEGAISTARWITGDTLIDRHIIEIGEETPEGTYQLWVGMYRPDTGERLAVSSATGEPVGDHIVLKTSAQIAP